jgi:hypothetical protein
MIGSTPDRHRNLNVLVQLRKKLHQAIHSEAANVSVADAREVCGGRASEGFRFTGRQFPVIENTDDLRGHNGAELFKVCVGPVKVAENVAATAY